MVRYAPLWLLVILQTAVSAASLVVEIVAGRMLAPYVGMSLYTWTSVIAVVLAGFSAGHWWGGRLAEREGRTALRITGWALLAAGLTTALAVSLMQQIAGPVLSALSHPVWAIVSLSMLVFFLPSFFAGVPAPVLAQIAVTRGDRSGRALGAIFAAGALGAIAGTLLAGFLFISWLGTAATLAAVTACYVIAGLTCFGMSGGRLVFPVLGGVAGMIAAGISMAAPAPCTLESRYFCIRSVDISADPGSPVRLMVIDHLAHGISARDAPRVMFTEHAAMLDALARLRAPRDDFTSFFIGGGSYSIPRSFADRGTGPRTVAEIDPAVTRLAARDFWFDPSGAEILHADARRALRGRPDARYDVILGDAFTDVAIPAHLVTREFFELARARLTPDGTFLMNVIDYADELRALASIVRSLRDVFPVVEVWTNTARPDPGARVVFVIAAGTQATPRDRFIAPAPERTEFGTVAPDWLNRVVESRGIMLTDDFAPIDRLIGPRN